MRRRGFTLIELLTAASVSLVVIAGLLGVAVQFQTTSLRQQQKMTTQSTLRAAAELLTLDLQKAGSGIGDVRIGLGGTTTVSPITLTTADAFVTDTGFAVPLGPYAALTSDSLTIYSGRTEELVSLACCPGVVNVGVCGTCSVRDAGRTCTALPAPASYTASAQVLFVNRTLGLACADELTAAPAANLLTSKPGLGSLGAPGALDPCNIASTFWCTAGTHAILLEGVTMRVNWKPTVPGGAQRPRLQRDPDGPLGPLPWEDLMWDVERMQVRVLVDDLTNPGNTLFYPEPDAGRPALDACTTATCPIAGGTDARDVGLALGLTAFDALQMQLQRRLRGVEVTLTSRSITADPSLIQRSGTGFELDAEGLPRDGFTRRRLIFQVSPRNYALPESS